MTAPLIAAPENRKPPAGTGGISESDLLAADQLHHTADARTVVDASWSHVVGLLLSAPPLGLARELLDALPLVAPDPVLEWWLNGIRLCVDAEVLPTPLTATDAAIRAGLDTPPGMRGLVLTRGSQMVSDVVGTPMACAPHLVRIIRAGMVRRNAEIAGERIRAAAWRGDLDALAELVQVEAGTLLASLAAERVTSHA